MRHKTLHIWSACQMLKQQQASRHQSAHKDLIISNETFTTELSCARARLEMTEICGLRPQRLQSRRADVTELESMLGKLACPNKAYGPLGRVVYSTIKFVPCESLKGKEYIDFALVEVRQERQCPPNDDFDYNRGIVTGDQATVLSHIGEAREGSVVMKRGKVTGLTTGTVSAMPADAVFRAEVDGQIVGHWPMKAWAVLSNAGSANQFSAPGDSGSVIFTYDERKGQATAVGQLFGGVEVEEGVRPIDVNLFTPITRVLELCRQQGYQLVLPDV